MGKIIGIDLGTTNSAVAVYENDRATIYENALGKRTTPSVIALKTTKPKDGGEATSEWIVGENAKRQSAMNPLKTLYGVKRLIGRRFDEPEVKKMQELASYKIVAGPNGDAWVEVDGKAMAPAEISAKVLRDLKDAVEKQLGEEITEAVITVPAYFNDAQRKATRDAGKIAGLDVKRIINEPTAAALAYGMDKKRGGKVAVFDLGGGTFDVSVLEVMIDEEEGNLVKVLATNGDTFLGGENFDEIVTEYLVSELNKEHGTTLDVSKKDNPTVVQRIREAAEKAKIDLSREEVVTVTLPFLMPDAEGQMINFETTITRNQLEKLLGPLIEKTVEPCRKALADAGLKIEDLDEVILVGGQTRMPLVINTVKKFFGKEPKRDVNPDEIVAMGASVQGAVLSGKVDNVILVDVIPLSIGIRAKDDLFAVMVPRNSSIPTTFKDEFSTAADNQRNVQVKIYQGERPIASQNKLLGEFTLDGIPPARAGEPKIEVSLDIDADGVLNVSAKDLKTGRAQKITVKANGGLSDDEVERMLKDAEANADADKAFRETLAAETDATVELKEAEADRSEDYFVNAPADLKQQFEETVAELTTAKSEKNVAVMVEKTAKLKEVRIAIGEAFNNSASESTPASDDAAPEQDGGSAPSAPKGPGM